MFKAYTYKLARSPLLYIGMIGVAILCCTEYLGGEFGIGSVQYHIAVFLGLAKYRKAIVVFGALPFAANFADEWTNSVTKDCVVRTGVKKYAAINVLICWFSAMLTVFGGMMLFMCFDSLFVPWTEVDTNPYGFIFEHFICEDRGEVYLMLITLVFAASCGMWAVMGMLLSVFFPNKYVAICSPFVASYVIERITMNFNDWFDLHDLALSYISYDYFDNDLLGFLYCVGLFAAIAAVCGVVFYIFFKKRVQNELT